MLIYQSFRASQQLFNDVIGTDNPDLSGFREAGGKCHSDPSLILF